MRFGIVQKEKFTALDGAYSLVTETEYKDSQITATDAEAEILVAAFGKENIHVGNVQSGRDAARKEFLLYPSGTKISLNLVYPKPHRTELRLYVSKSAGYKPNPGHVWFLFIKAHQVWIGSMPVTEWRKENSTYREDAVLDEPSQLIDVADADIQKILRQRLTYCRDAKIAKKRMELSRYKCEFDTSHNLFISRYTGVPFLESHHLVPMNFQAHLPKQKLDVINNVFCLCPNCHRAIHHADESFARKILNKLSGKRDILSTYEMAISDLYRLYSVEEITR
jgi:5-methylcytosine-specific restriction protein A